jgi:hypothetical protein
VTTSYRHNRYRACRSKIFDEIGMPFSAYLAEDLSKKYRNIYAFLLVSARILQAIYIQYFRLFTSKIAPHDGSCGACVFASVARIPDPGVEVFFVGPSSTTQIGVELLGAKFRGGDREADIFLAGRFAFLLSTRTDFNALSQNPEVRLAVRGLLLVWHDVYLGLDADGAQVALVTTVVFFADITDCSHLKSPIGCSLGNHSPAMRDRRWPPPAA